MTGFLDRRDAPLFPSRHRYALFRLTAWLRLRRAERASDPTHLYFVDADQTSIEQYGAAIAATAAGTIFFAAALARHLPTWLAFVVGLPLAAISLQLPVVVLGPTLLPLWERLTGRPLNRIRVQSRLTMVMLAGGAAFALRGPSWARLGAALFFGTLASNAVAAVILLFARRDIARLEHGGEP